MHKSRESEPFYQTDNFDKMIDKAYIHPFSQI